MTIIHIPEDTEIQNLSGEEEAALLAVPLSSEDIAAVQDELVQIAAGQTIPWETLAAERKAARETRRKKREQDTDTGRFP